MVMILNIMVSYTSTVHLSFVFQHTFDVFEFVSAWKWSSYTSMNNWALYMPWLNVFIETKIHFPLHSFFYIFWPFCCFFLFLLLLKMQELPDWSVCMFVCSFVVRKWVSIRNFYFDEIIYWAQGKRTAIKTKAAHASLSVRAKLTILA